jgi:hypothetical protein
VKLAPIFSTGCSRKTLPDGVRHTPGTSGLPGAPAATLNGDDALTTTGIFKIVAHARLDTKSHEHDGQPLHARNAV